MSLVKRERWMFLKYSTYRRRNPPRRKKPQIEPQLQPAVVSLSLVCRRLKISSRQGDAEGGEPSPSRASAARAKE
jgi:hypothetical protein